MSLAAARKNKGKPQPIPNVSEWSREKCMEIMRRSIFNNLDSVKFSPVEHGVVAEFVAQACTLEKDIKSLSTEIKDHLLYQFISILRAEEDISDINWDEKFKSSILYVEKNRRYDDDPDWNGYYEMIETLKWDRLRELTTQLLGKTYSGSVDKNSIWLQGEDDKTSNILSSAELLDRLPPRNGQPVTQYIFQYLPHLQKQWNEETNLNDYVQTLTREDLVWIVRHMYTNYNITMRSGYHSQVCELMTDVKKNIFESLARADLDILANKLNLALDPKIDDTEFKCKILESAYRAYSKSQDLVWFHRYAALPFDESQEAYANIEREKLIEKELANMSDEELVACIKNIVRRYLKEIVEKDDIIFQRYKLHLVHYPTDNYQKEILEKMIAKMTRSDLIIAWTITVSQKY